MNNIILGVGYGDASRNSLYIAVRAGIFQQMP